MPSIQLQHAAQVSMRHLFFLVLYIVLLVCFVADHYKTIKLVVDKFDEVGLKFWCGFHETFGRD